MEVDLASFRAIKTIIIINYAVGTRDIKNRSRLSSCGPQEIWFLASCREDLCSMSMDIECKCKPPLNL